MPLGDLKGYEKPTGKFPGAGGMPGMGTANPGAYSGTSGPLFEQTPFGMPALENYVDQYQTQYIDPFFNAQADAARNQYGIDAATINYEQGLFERDNALAQSQLALQQQIAGINAAAQQAGLADIATLEALARRRLGLTNQQLDVRGKAAGEQRITRDFENKSQATSRGSVFSAGTRNRTRDIGQAYDNEMENIRIGREQAQAGFEQEMVGFNQARRAARTSAEIANATAAQYGFQRQELENALADGLAQFGIRGQGAIDTLLQALDSNDQARQAEALNIFNQALMMQTTVGLPPEAYASIRNSTQPDATLRPDYSQQMSYGR